MNKSVKFIILLIIYSIALYISYNIGMTDYAYILAISATWIIIIQSLDNQLSNTEKITLSVLILLIEVMAELGRVGFITSIVSSMGVLITEMVLYALITETTYISKIPKTIKTILIFLAAFLIAFLIEWLLDKVAMGLASFFTQGMDGKDGFDSQYAISTFIYNLKYSIPICINILLVSYIIGKSYTSSYKDFKYVILIIFVPLAFCTYMNMLADQYTKAGQEFINTMNSYESYLTPNQYQKALESVKLGQVKYDEKDSISYYTENYFYNAPYSIECIAYNYREAVGKYTNTSKARFNKKELDIIKALTTNVITDTEVAIDSCNANSSYMWAIYLINSISILIGYTIFKNAKNNSKQANKITMKDL